MGSKTSNACNVKNNVKRVKNTKKKKGRTKEEVVYYDPIYVPPAPPKVQKENKAKNPDLNIFWRFAPKNKFMPKDNVEKKPRKSVNIRSVSPIYQIEAPLSASAISIGNMSSLLSRRENDNTAAVLEARLEIEKIKTELETLINSNIKTQSYYSDSVNLIPKEVETLLDTVQETCEAFSKKESPKPKIKTSALRPQTSPPVKKIVQPSNCGEDTGHAAETARGKSQSRTYNPESTREFIRKQKQRRREKLLEEEQKKLEQEITRKQKLEELKKKTLELVAKNLKKSSTKSARTTSDVTSKSNAQLDNKMNKFALQSRRCRARSFDHTNTNRNRESAANKRSRSVSREIIKKAKAPPSAKKAETPKKNKSEARKKKN